MNVVLDKKKLPLSSLKKFIEKLLEEYGIKGKCLIPSAPDIEGDYFIVVYAKNIKSSDKAIELSLKIQKILSDRFGSNIVFSIVPD